MKETEKMFNVIHDNRKKVYDQKIEAEEEARKKEKKETRKNNIKRIFIGFILTTLIVSLAYLFNEKEIRNCMEDGYSENFCRFAGE